MPRKRRRLKERIFPLGDAQRLFLETGERAPEEAWEKEGGFGPFDAFLASGGSEPNRELARLWQRYGDIVTEAWVEENPGSRPWAWWACEVPEEERPARGRGLTYLRRHGLLLPGEPEAVRERKHGRRESEGSEVGV
jgi:hypothetical protein